MAMSNTLNPSKSTDILIVGGGIIGLTIAHRLRHTNRAMILMDPAGPGRGASRGNAGTIADYAIMPVGSPAVLKNLPALLFNRNSPLSIRKTAILSLAPWLLRFLLQSLPTPTQRNMQALANILADAGQRWKQLAEHIQAQALLKANGCLYLYEDHRSSELGWQDISRRQSYGIEASRLTPQQLARLEPQLPPLDGGAAFFPNAMYLSDPGDFLTRLFKWLIDRDLQFQQASVVGLARQKSGVEATLSDGSRISAKQVIIAAGAYSRELAHMSGDPIPLETERGYHLEFDLDQPLLQRPASASSRGFYMTPMQGRLRVAGTVELGGLNPKLSQHRLDRLQQGIKHYFPDIGTANRRWLGFRPSIPDSRPVISASKYGNDIIYAFGHGHIGMTLAPITAELVYALLTATTPPIDLRDFSARRF
jgi:D-amino-acid dehydrogenase